MANVKVLQIDRLVFALPDNFTGDLPEAFRHLATYVERQWHKQIETPTDPRVSAGRSFVEVLQGGGKLIGAGKIHTLNVPDVERPHPSKQNIIIPEGIAGPNGK